MQKSCLMKELYNKEFLYNWVNWRETLAEMQRNADSLVRESSNETVNEKNNDADKAVRVPNEITFENFIDELKKLYAEYTPEFAEAESGATAEMIREVAKKIGEAGTRFATHNWRSAGAGNLGGWAVSRCLHFLNVLTGSVGTVGGTMPSAWNKFKPKGFSKPPAQKFWNELHFPNEYPLAHYEMSFLLPHFLKEGRGTIGHIFYTRI